MLDGDGCVPLWGQRVANNDDGWKRHRERAHLQKLVESYNPAFPGESTLSRQFVGNDSGIQRSFGYVVACVAVTAKADDRTTRLKQPVQTRLSDGLDSA